MSASTLVFLCCQTWLGSFLPPRCETAFSFLWMCLVWQRKHGADIRIFMLVNQHKMECHAGEMGWGGQNDFWTPTGVCLVPVVINGPHPPCKRTICSVNKERGTSPEGKQSAVFCSLFSRQVQAGLGTLRCSTHPEICRPGWWPAWTEPPPPWSSLFSSQRQLRGHGSSLGQGATGQVISCVFRS